MNNIFKETALIGRYFRHYKGATYKVLNIATHTETNEKLVIYHNINDKNIWARPLEDFTSFIDKDLKRFTELQIKE